MHKESRLPRPEFVVSTIEIFNQELFDTELLHETQEMLDKWFFSFILLPDREEIDKQVSVHVYKKLKTLITSIQNEVHPEEIEDFLVTTNF
jgi:hypothetical protein